MNRGLISNYEELNKNEKKKKSEKIVNIFLYIILLIHFWIIIGGGLYIFETIINKKINNIASGLTKFDSFSDDFNKFYCILNKTCHVTLFKKTCSYCDIT